MKLKTKLMHDLLTTSSLVLLSISIEASQTIGISLSPGLLKPRYSRNRVLKFQQLSIAIYFERYRNDCAINNYRQCFNILVTQSYLSLYEKIFTNF